MIMDKTGFDPRIIFFFSTYLINRKPQYIWNNFISPFFRANVGVGQGFALSLILSALYITLIFHILKKRTQNLLSSIFVSTLSFVDDGLFIFQEKSYEKSNVNLFCSYSIISFLFKQFSLITEHNKSEVFHFSRATKNFDSLPLDLGLLEEPIL